MSVDTIDYEKGETPMTDLQFLEYKRVSDELTEARREIEMLRGSQGASDSDGMTDYQFQEFNKLWDERNALRDENEVLKKELELLRGQQTGN